MNRFDEQPSSIQNYNAAGRTIFSNTSNPPDYLEKKHRFSTVNKEIHNVQPMPDFTSFKQNFKRKSIFQQWTDATYNHGVYFNPGVNCL